MPRQVDPSALLARYRNGEHTQVGREIFEALPVRARVPWAGRVLQACIQALRQPVPPEVDAVLALTSDPRRWRQGHEVFDAVRRSALHAESGGQSPQLKALLQVAELVAKVTYNASGDPAPFDANIGWRLGPAAMALAHSLGDVGCERDIWYTLTVPPVGSSRT